MCSVDRARRLRCPLFALVVAFGVARDGHGQTATSPNGGDRRPNVVVILTDDQRFDTIGTEHAPDGSTPVMPTVARELVGRGVGFSNSFTTTALCAPSRASLLSGRYASATGVHDNHGPHALPAFDETQTLATWLHGAGYVTALFGKYVNGYEDGPPYTPPGWEEWRAFRKPAYFDYELVENGTIVPYGHEEQDYSTDVLGAKTAAFIRERAGRAPFFVYFAPFAPHVPATPAPRHVGRFAEASPWRPANFDEADVSDKPAWVQGIAPWNADRVADTDALDRRQLECLQAVDDAVGAILSALRETGAEESTVVLYASDNGYAWGAHRWQAKECPYEECMRVPLVVRYPPLVTEPRTESRVGLNIDYAETLTELTGATAGPGVQGTSLVPLLAGSVDGWRADFVEEHWRRAIIPAFVQLRTTRWKYTAYATSEAELYDLRADPLEQANLVHDPAHAALVARLATRLRALRPASTPSLLARLVARWRALRHATRLS